MDGKRIAEIIEEVDCSDPESSTSLVIKDYVNQIDGELIRQGWDFEGAKTVGYGKHDQSLLNHVRNGVFFLGQLNQVAAELGVRRLSETELRNAIGLFVAHDLHKTLDSSGPDEEFDIPRKQVTKFVTTVGLLDFAPKLTVDDCWSCARAHHDSWKAKASRVTLAYTELQGHVRLADAFASSPRPEDAVSDRTRRNVDDVFYGDIELHHHQFNEVKGILTSLLNEAIADLLAEHGYRVIAIYQEGCVYASKPGARIPSIDESFIEEAYHAFTTTVRESHLSYGSPAELMESIETGRLGYYGPSDEDFFYAGPNNVLEAIVLKAAWDGDTDDDPTDSMSTGIEKTAAEVPIELDDTRQLVGAARLVYGVHRTVIPKLDSDRDDFLVTCDLFGVSDEVRDALLETRERDPGLLKSGGKWEYSYAIGQELLDREFDGVQAKRLSPREFGETVTQYLIQQLSEYEGWETIADEFTADIRQELIAYLAETITVDGYSATMENELSDPYIEYSGGGSGKLCTLCNRGTTSGRKSDMEAKKSLTTLQAGFSNRVQIGSGKPEQLLMCAPCRIEFSLRETGGDRREPGRLFFHLAPDYFYTPLSWAITRRILGQYDDEASVRMGRLAEQLFEGVESEEAYSNLIEELTSKEGGMGMVEDLSQGFTKGFGATQLSYFKPRSNDTEFQFFGVYLALAVSTYSGLRVLVTENPVPEIRARDYKEMVRIGAGLAPVKRFYGDTVELDALERTLRSSSALILLGYAIDRTDSLFPKYLRSVRNKPLPGSYLLKRIAQATDEGSRIAWSLMDEARFLDRNHGNRPNTMTETNDVIDELARRAFDVVRPTSYKPYAVERAFRESVKAITEVGTTRPGRKDCKHYVAGRIQKMIDRSEQVYPVSAEKSEHGANMGERVEFYAEFFVDRVLFDLCDGKPSRLKRLSNNFADGFYAATLRLKREQNKTSDEAIEQTASGDTQ